MNTCSRLPERARSSSLRLGWVDTTNGCSVSFFLGVRQAFIVHGLADALVFAQAGTLQFKAVRAMNDAVQDRVANRRITEQFVMPQSLIGESLTSQ